MSSRKVYKECGRHHPKVTDVIRTFQEPTKILIVFWHGLGDLLMFQPVYDALCREFPRHYFDLGLLPGVGHRDIFPDGKEIPEKDFLKEHDVAFVVSFPMIEGSNAMTKVEYCVAKEVGDVGHVEPLVSWGRSLAVKNARSRLVGVHFQGTCLPGSTNPKEPLAHQIWDDIVEAGYIPLDLHMQHVFHNPVNARFHWATRHLRDLRDPSLNALQALLSPCFAVVAVASGPFVLAVCQWPEKTVFLQKHHKIDCYLKDFANVVDLLKYDKKVLIDMLNKIYKNQKVM